MRKQKRGNTNPNRTQVVGEYKKLHLPHNKWLDKLGEE